MASVHPNKLHGLLFDGTVFTGNIILFGFLPQINADLSEKTVGALLLVALLTQLTRAWLKRRPLQFRLSQTTGTRNGDLAASFLKTLLFFHFILFSVSTLMAFSLLEFVGPDAGGAFLSKDDVWIAFSLALGALTSAVVWRAGKVGGGDIVSGSQAKWVEYVADGLLWVSVFIMTRFFWKH
jgi:hypothetical protein